jgi:Family of unknown function (DUF5752)
MSSDSRLAKAPFEIFALAHVSRMGGQAAATLRELADGLETCSDESIYNHTIVAMRSYLVLSEEVTNDYARWAQTSLRREDLAAHLAMADMKDCQTRRSAGRSVEHCSRVYRGAAGIGGPEGGESVLFLRGNGGCGALGSDGAPLEEFRQCVREMRGESFYLHFVAPRTRHENRSNDFSEWLEKSLGMHGLAAKINEIDVMDTTLEGAREKILELLGAEKDAPLKVTAAGS